MIDWLIDLQWTSSPYGPFVPHNLISAYEGPVPLPKFQIQEKNPDILFFYPNRPGKQIPSSFPNRTPMERDNRLQGIFTYLLI
jgi:hypothetical protein